MGDELCGRERYREVGILEAAPTVTICDGALESVFTCYGAIEIIVYYYYYYYYYYRQLNQ